MDQNPFTLLLNKLDHLEGKIDVLSEALKNRSELDESIQSLRINDVVRILKISKTTLHRRMKSGEIKFVKRGRTVYFARKEIEKYLGK